MCIVLTNSYSVQCQFLRGYSQSPHNTDVLNVLFVLAHWHALAKLRQHTDLSLSILESITVQLGKLLRKFQANTCSAYNTRELGREMSARVRHAASKSSNQQTSKPPSNVAEAENQTRPTSGNVSTSTPTSDLEVAASQPTKSAGRQA